MRLKRIMVAIITITIVTSLIGCSNSTIGYNNQVKGLVSEVEYPEGIGYEDYNGKKAVWENNKVSKEYIEALSNFSNKTTSDILSTGERTTNTMYSPISLFMALAICASAANGQTQEEILSVLGMTGLGVDQLEYQTGNLYRLLYKDNKIGQLRLANSVWLDKDITFNKTFVDTAVEDYYASIFSVDFSDKETGNSMSEWISENSKGTLEGTQEINEDQIMSIINTIYFYDEWIDRFDENKTEEDIFYSYDGKEIVCDFMNMRYSSHSFTDGEGYISSSLGFKNNAYMKFYLPDEGVDVYDLISTEEKIAELFSTNNPKNEEKCGEVIFQIPKFSFGCTLYLEETLENMGIESAFEKDADFSNLTNEDIVFISKILQSTHISIDEKGCEASAYTKIDYDGSALPVDKAEMILDRPFIFTIVSSKGVMLFVGVVNNPIV